jgi:putative transcriptional regulator
MIRVKLREALIEKEFKDGKSLSMKDVSLATGIHVVTLSKITKNRGYNPTLELIDKLCAYFDCELSDLLVRVRDEEKDILSE